jgi:2-iminobutanoate/2-iminopropanoate deaminase
MTSGSGKQAIQPAGSFDAERLGYSQGVLIGGVLHVSGQVSRASDLPTQVEEAWSSVVAVVEDAGGTAADIAKITVFTRDEAAWSHLQPLVEASMSPPYPAATMVTVVGLASPELLVEIEAVAYPSGGGR